MNCMNLIHYALIPAYESWWTWAQTSPCFSRTLSISIFLIYLGENSCEVSKKSISSWTETWPQRVLDGLQHGLRQVFQGLCVNFWLLRNFDGPFIFTKVGLYPGIHETKTEQAEEVEIFNDQKSVMLSSFSSSLSPVWHETEHFYPFVLLTPNTPLIQLWCTQSKWNMGLILVFLD